MYFFGNKVSTAEMLLDPAGLRPDLYRMSPEERTRKMSRYPNNRSTQPVPLNVELDELARTLEAKGETSFSNMQFGMAIAPQYTGKEYADSYRGVRPPAPHRQAWTNHPAFRFFRRRDEFK